ncbi:MAG: DNA alkylation repair protein [Promethearchaeota archaeon]
MIEKIIREIKNTLKTKAPHLTEVQRSRMYKILNSDNPDFIGLGNKHSDIEKLVRNIQKEYNLTYQIVLDIFKILIRSNVYDEKIAGIFLLNRFKKDFSRNTIKMIGEVIPKYFDTWAITDTTIIRVIGPFLAKSINNQLAEQTIEEWSNSQNHWNRRAALVIFLKIVMVNKNFRSDAVFSLVERMREDPEEYVHKGIGWLLKTCSNYDPDIIFEYLMKNKQRLSRIILRYASEKLPKDKRAQILKK